MITPEPAFILSTISLSIALIFLMLRCISRYYVIRQGGIDDILAVGAGLTSLTLTIFKLELRRYGVGEDWNQLDNVTKNSFLKYFWLTVACFCSGITLVKISATFQYLRFIKFSRMRIFCWIFLAVNIGFAFSGTFATIFICKPVSTLWDVTIHDGKCNNLAAWFYICAGFVVLTDVVIFLIPIIALKDLNLPSRQKLALIGVFSLAGCAVIMSGIRASWVYRFLSSGNYSLYETSLGMWSSLELNTGIICICAPPLKVLVDRITPKIFQTKLDSQLSSNDHLISANSISQHTKNELCDCGRAPMDVGRKYSITGSCEQGVNARQSSVSTMKTPFITSALQVIEE